MTLFFSEVSITEFLLYRYSWSGGLLDSGHFLPQQCLCTHTRVILFADQIPCQIDSGYLKCHISFCKFNGSTPSPNARSTDGIDCPRMKLMSRQSTVSRSVYREEDNVKWTSSWTSCPQVQWLHETVSTMDWSSIRLILPKVQPHPVSTGKHYLFQFNSSLINFMIDKRNTYTIYHIKKSIIN